MRRTHFAVGLLSLTASCVYFNSMYDAQNTYAEAVQIQRDGIQATARVQFDSVIAITERIVSGHPESKYAASASLMKTRAELANQLPAAAANTAMGMSALSDKKRDLDTAAGLEGVARRQLDELAAADPLLSQALAGEISDEDEALFLFHRGMARLESGRTDQAAEDLAATGIQSELSMEGRLDLARALSDVGQYAASARLTGALVRENKFANFEQSLHVQLDTLARRAPVILDSTLAIELDQPEQPDSKRSALYYFRGRSREQISDTLAALQMYDG
ncbi:MAG: hypothetical protein E4H28_05705, partial [Gemmatimonadales bacterium]